MSATEPNVPLDVQNYRQVVDAFNLIKGQFGKIEMRAEASRRMRKLAVDVEELRSSGKIRPDQTFIARRVIDTNIKNEQPPFIAYLKQSRRLAVFKCKSDPTVNVEQIETEFTEGMQYVGWEESYFKVLDGAQLHGWDAVEIEYDTSKPLNVAVVHIGHEDLIFPVDARGLNPNEMIGRRFRVTPSELRKLRRYNFRPEQVEALIKASPDRAKSLQIYKVFVKQDDGIVYVCWIEPSLTDFLSPPVKLDLGRRKKQMVEVPQKTVMADGTVVELPPVQQEMEVPIDETEFPVKLLLYSLNEQKLITEQIGHSIIDEPDQEAQTNLWTSAVNGALRASNVYGAPEQDESNGGKLSVVDVELIPDRIYNKPIKFWSPPWPEGFVMTLAQQLATSKAAETSSVDFAVNNREDSRKTATEIQAAGEQANLLKGVQVMLWSAFLRDVFNFVWPMVQNYALRGEIDFCRTQVTITPNPALPEITQTVVQNDTQLIGQVYDIKAAGDIDVVQRAEKLQRMQTMWPIISQTPLAMPFLMDIMKEMFPQDYPRYAQMMGSMQQDKQLLQGVLGIMQELQNMPPEQVGPALAQYKPQLEQMGMQIQQSVQQQPTQ